jgi:hypothetical protein
MTKVVSCSCSSVQQDKLYGKGRRVANSVLKPAPRDKSHIVVRCTVCAKIQEVRL